MPKKELVSHPFCPTCGRVAPDHTFAVCTPCLNGGHYYRLIQNESDRHASLARWLCFWSDQGFTGTQVKGIPTYINLKRYTFSQIAAMKSAKEQEE